MAKDKDDKPMTEDQEALFADTYHTTANQVDALKDEAEANSGRLPCREFSIALTKLEEAEMWLERGFAELKYELPEDDEDDEDDEDEDDPKKVDEEE